MKTHLFLLALLCASVSLSAQTQLTVFFEHNSSFISPTTRATLDALASGVAADSLIGRIALQGFGDQGQQTGALGKERALSVSRYLQGKGVRAEQIEILQPDFHSAFHRNDARMPVQRVDIQLSRNGYAQVQDLLQSLDTEKPELFRLPSQKPMTVFTARGTAVALPQDGFVQADGSLYRGQVQFSVKEAFNYKEMIAQGLTTSSGGKLLETGGMLYLEALDTLGRELELAPGKEIRVNLPTKQASLPRMQVFTASFNENGAVDWQPADSWVKTADESKREESTPIFDNHPTPDNAALAQAQALLKVFLQFNPQQLPDAPTVFLPLRPQYPILKYKTKAEIAATMRQGYKESYGSFQDRIHQAYLKEIVEPLQAYEAAKAQYPADSAAFVQAHPEYVDYCQEVIRSLREINAVTRFMTKKDYTEPLQRAHKEIQNIWQASPTHEIYGLERNAASKAYTYPAFKPLYQSLDSLGDRASANGSALYDLYRTLSSNDYAIDSYWDQAESLRNRFSSLLAKAEQWQIFDRDMIAEIQKAHSALLKGDALRYRDMQAEARPLYEAIPAFLALYPRLDQVFSDFAALRKRYFELQKELGILTEEDIFDIYNNSLKINRLGWINCDRFIDDASTRTQLHILAEAPSDVQTTRYFVVFQDIKSVMAFEPQGNEFVVKNIPAGQAVTVVGIRVEGVDQSSVFTQSGTVGDLQGKIHPAFEAQDLEEVLAMLDM